MRRRLVFAVFVQRGRSDHVQLTAGERGLQHVGRVHRPFGSPRPDQRVQLVDEHDVAAGGAGDLLQHRLQALLKFAAVLGARDEGTQVERDEVLLPERIGDVAVHDPLRQALDDRGLTHPRLADQDRVVLRAPRQHLHHAPDLLVPPDHRIELRLAGLLREVERETLERLVLLLGLLVGDAMRAAHSRERGEHIVPRHARRRQELPRGRTLLLSEGQEQMLGRDIRVAQPFCFLVGAIEHLREFARQRRLDGDPLLRRETVQLALRVGFELGDVQPRLLQQRDDDAVVLGEKGVEQMGVVQDGVAARARQRPGLLQGLGGLHGQTFRSNHGTGALGNLRAR